MTAQYIDLTTGEVLNRPRTGVRTVYERKDRPRHTDLELSRKRQSQARMGETTINRDLLIALFVYAVLVSILAFA